MEICPRCKKDVRGFVFCPYCGYGLKEKPKEKKEKTVPLFLRFSLTPSFYSKLKEKFETKERLKEEVLKYLKSLV